MLGGLRPQAPKTFGLNPSSQLVSVSKSSSQTGEDTQSSNSLGILNIKSTISQKLKI